MNNNQFLFKTNAEAFAYFENTILTDDTKLIYFNTVKLYLNTLLPNKTIVITDIANSENIQKFLQCVSVYMASYPENTIVFSDDYKSFKKQ